MGDNGNGCSSILETAGVSKSFGHRHALKGVSVKMVEALYVLTGPNGSGKTTLLKIVSGIIRPDAGRVLFRCRDVTGEPPWLRRFTYMGAPHSLIPSLSVRENLELALKASKPGGHWDFKEIVSRLGIEDLLGLKPRDISSGEAQRVGIAQALLSSPNMLLLDEPLSYVDAEYRREVVRLVLETMEAGTPVVLSTHSWMDAVEFPGSRVGVLIGGKLVYEGRASDLASGPGNVEVLRSLGYPNLFDRAQLEKLGLDKKVLERCQDPGYIWVPPGSVRIGCKGLVGSVIESSYAGGAFTVVLEANGLRIEAVAAPKDRPGGKASIEFCIDPEEVIVYRRDGSRCG